MAGWIDERSSVWCPWEHQVQWCDHETRSTVGLLEHQAGLPMVFIEEVVHQVGADHPYPDEHRQTYSARDAPQAPAMWEPAWSDHRPPPDQSEGRPFMESIGMGRVHEGCVKKRIAKAPKRQAAPQNHTVSTGQTL
jgi:hypothetical protein